MNGHEGQGGSVGLWQVTDGLVHQGNAVILIRQL
jgi:hypothetical protein